ncbi:MAG: hypothetical protein IJ328_03675 [Muribaculaceae bacterium]|nr:hypothetical protein [Muribaculaceae bacterium]
MRLITVFIAAILAWECFAADYDKLEAKAERFVAFQEWNSANAMYLLMMDMRPDKAVNYARAIVTSGIMADDDAQMSLLERTQRQGMALDSVFTEVRDFSFEIGCSREYERFLILVKERQPWMARHINTRLLKYYDFRNDAPEMVAIGNELLSATPDEIGYISIVARGYMILGEFERAVVYYNRILALDDCNYAALLALGNYNYVMWKASEGTRSQLTSTAMKALEFMQRAYELSPTPFVSKVMEELKAAYPNAHR